MSRAPDSLRWFRWLLLVVAIGSCWPLVVCRADFQRLFLFQDEWDQIRQMDQEGLWPWAFSMFGENFMPLSKLVWAGMLHLGNGSYFALVAAVWVTHAVNVFLLGWLLVRRGVCREAALFVAVLFGYSATTLETMAWSIQWSNVLPLTFFLVALLQLERLGAPDARWRDYVVFGALLLMSSLSFVRGMFCGAAIVGAIMVPGVFQVGWRRRLVTGGVAAAAVVVVLLGMKLGGFGSGQQAARYTWGVIGQSAMFAWHAFAHNPVVNWWTGAPLGGVVLVTMTLAKGGVLIGGLRWAPTSLRPVLWSLLLFELANDAALGLGRYHTGLAAAASSRYQYTSLVAFLPFVAVVVGRGLEALGDWPRSRRALAIGATVVAGYLVTAPWPTVMRSWSGWRGGDLRAALALPREQAPEKLPHLEWISYDEAHAVMGRHHLH